MTDALLAVVQRGVRVFDLGRPMFPGMPQSPNHPAFSHTLPRRHGDMMRADGGSAANDLIVTGTHVGTHIDALAHVSHDGCLPGGADARAAGQGGRYLEHGVHTIAPMVRRGVLLDVPAALGGDTCPAAYEITPDDLDTCCRTQQVEPGAGDVVLVRSGWGRQFDEGLDSGGVTHALGIAASMASGIIEANRTGGTVKRTHCGWAAHAAVSAAQLAAHGFTGPPTVLEGRFGFYRAWLHGKFDPAAITGGLGETWLVPDIFFKPYPANHFTHAAIDAAIELRSAGLAPGDVESATLGVAAPTVHTIGEPIEVKRAPRTGYMAQFSGPYAVAAGLLGGAGLGVGLADFTDELAVEPARRALMARVDVVADDRCSEVFPHQFPAVLRVRTKDSRELVAEVMANRGGPGWPLSYEELATKFRDNAGRLLDAATVTATERAVADLDHARGLDDLLEPLGQLPDRPAHG